MQRLTAGTLCTALAACACAVLSDLAPVRAQQVGTAAAVNQDASVSGRTLTLGAAIMHKERVQTDTKGSLQLLFLDRTSLSVGPNSNLVIDEYVYNPARSVGRMTVSLGKGVMRFVGGQISHSGEATVKTPPATIGIRGGIAVLSTQGGRTTVSNVFGSVTITSGGNNLSLPQGQTATVGGGSPTVGPTTAAQLSAANRQLQSSGAQTGGASSRAAAAASSLSRSTTTTSAITPASAPAAGSTASGPSGGTGGGAAASFAAGFPPSVNSAIDAAQTSSASAAAAASAPLPAPGGGGGGGP